MYGCRACSSKALNKWYNLFDVCKKSAWTYEEVQVKLKWYTARLDAVMPALGYESEDELKCDQCDVIFRDIKDLRAHFNECHPESGLKYKRGKSHAEEKKGRRPKNVPVKSLEAK